MSFPMASPELTALERAWVGRKWIEAGLGEHASVAAFARVVLDLLRLGAPPGLLLDAIQAMRDEVEHARLCFGIARHFNEAPAGPGPMSLPAGIEERSVEVILESAILEGCFEEVISAQCARVACDRAEDPRIRAAIDRIAADELRHSELSWCLVEWMLQRHSELRHVALAAFATGLKRRTEAMTGEDYGMPETCGHLLRASRQQVREETLDRIIWPRARVLLGITDSADVAYSHAAR